MLSMSTDYATDTGSPELQLRRIAEAGFTHVHWCHHWDDDFLYGTAEIDQIARWLDNFGLQLNGVHASEGIEKCWYSMVEYQRLAGVELVRNRIEMTATLGGDFIVLHLVAGPEDEAGQVTYWDSVRRSLDGLEPLARERGVRIALENLTDGNVPLVRRSLEQYAPEIVGLCYDSGHGNITGDGPELLASLEDRLIALHLHDNDAQRDQHLPLFQGTVDWDRLASLIAHSSYDKMVSLEVTMHNAGIADEAGFLTRCHNDAVRFAEIIDSAQA